MIRLISKLYFRSIVIIGRDSVPSTGPAIIACNHNSQFVDAMMLVLAIDRPVNFVIAASSTKNPFLKYFLKFAKIIPTVRPIDNRKCGKGVILEVKDDVFIAQDTTFLTDLKVGDILRIHGLHFEFQVAQVISDTEVKIKIPTELKTPRSQVEKTWKEASKGQKYDIMPKLNQSAVHEKAVEALSRGEIIVIFPEGGSHDQTQLLPLKAGACLFLWSAQEKGVDCPLVCVGVNYYGSHKFRSKVVINIAAPANLPLDPAKKDVKEYKYEYISNALDTLKWGLESVKINTHSYQQLLALNCAKEIFLDKKDNLDPKFDFLLLQRFCAGFDRIANHPDTQELLPKIERFRKRVKVSGLTVKDLRKYESFISRNLAWMVLKLIVQTIVVG